VHRRDHHPARSGHRVELLVLLEPQVEQRALHAREDRRAVFAALADLPHVQHGEGQAGGEADAKSADAGEPPKKTFHARQRTPQVGPAGALKALMITMRLPALSLLMLAACHNGPPPSFYWNDGTLIGSARDLSTGIAAGSKADLVFTAHGGTLTVESS